MGGFLHGGAPEAHDLLPWPGDLHEGGDNQLAPRPPPCSLSEVREDMAPGACAAAAEHLGVGFRGGGGSVAPPRHLGAQAAPGRLLGSAGGGAAYLQTLAAHRRVAFGPRNMAGGYVSSRGPPSLGGATWGRRGLLKSGEETGDPAGWG